MESPARRQRITEDAIIKDLASSFRDLSESLNSSAKSCETLLKVNKAIVLHIRDAKKEQGIDIDEIGTTLRQTMIEEED